MQLYMTALEHHLADVQVRERFSFSERRIRELLPLLKEETDAAGTVLLHTCSRTELYIASENAPSLSAALCRAAGTDPSEYEHLFTSCSGEEAFLHLAEVACGLRSSILCEDQIITQVNHASLIARESGTHCPLTETAFRLAVTAAKKAKSEVRVCAVPRSAAERAAEMLIEKVGRNSSVLVIGNGEMGRICASLLREAGCRVTVTLRTYRHGETVIPFGCGTIPYDRRTELLEHCDAVVSATASPHHTLSIDMFRDLARKPRLLIDLAVPRDIDPALDVLIPCLNIDHMTTPDERQNENCEAIAHIRNIIAGCLEQYRQWLTVRVGTDFLSGIKQKLCQKFCQSADMNEQALIEDIVSRTVDALFYAAHGQITPEMLETIEQNLRR